MVAMLQFDYGLDDRKELSNSVAGMEATPF